MKEDSFRVGGAVVAMLGAGLCAIGLGGGIRWRGVSTRTFSYSGLQLAVMSYIVGRL